MYHKTIFKTSQNGVSTLALEYKTGNSRYYFNFVHTCAGFIQGASVELRRTPLTVESSGVVKTLEALSRSGVTVTTDAKVYIVVTLALAALAILLLGRKWS